MKDRSSSVGHRSDGQIAQKDYYCPNPGGLNKLCSIPPLHFEILSLAPGEDGKIWRAKRPDETDEFGERTTRFVQARREPVSGEK